jgi:2-keto-4-pentenoate hydratase/2-oxohepta-3-ene-1,7-dioic acid hydratase in catechol pathway
VGLNSNSPCMKEFLEGGNESLEAAKKTRARFQKQPSLVCGPGDPIIKPRVTGMLDHENELAVVIGKRGKYIPKERAYEYIGGYTILIDVSFRDQRFPTDIPWKAYDRRPNTVTRARAPMGPCLVTKDEITNPYSPPLRIITRVNGETRQDGDLSTMMIKIPRLIEYLSMGTTLEPGDVIATGTVPRVGRAYNAYLNVGDIVECEIPPIGVLKHKVIEDQ